MDTLSAEKEFLKQKPAKPGVDGVIKYALVFAISLSVVLIVLANYGNIINLLSRIEYFVNSDKQSDNYEYLTNELIALYGSGRIEYYQRDSGLASSRVSNENANMNTGSMTANAASNGSLTNSNSLYVPGININAPIVAGYSTEEKTILNQLKQGVLIYPGSNLPGEGGSTVIIGHSSSNSPWNKYSRIFSSLPKLSKGDLIVINYNGKKYSYSVDKKFTGSVSELASLGVTGDLILGTCWPIGTDEQRVLISAKLQ